jgi:hypothetical protein
LEIQCEIQIISLVAPFRRVISRYGTIDRLFSELKVDLDGKADEISVTYDPMDGYPSQVIIDFMKQAVDDELSSIRKTPAIRNEN